MRFIGKGSSSIFWSVGGVVVRFISSTGLLCYFFTSFRFCVGRSLVGPIVARSGSGTRVVLIVRTLRGKVSFPSTEVFNKRGTIELVELLSGRVRRCNLGGIYVMTVGVLTRCLGDPCTAHSRRDHGHVYSFLKGGGGSVSSSQVNNAGGMSRPSYFSGGVVRRFCTDHIDIQRCSSSPMASSRVERTYHVTSCAPSTYGERTSHVRIFESGGIVEGLLSGRLKARK